MPNKSFQLTCPLPIQDYPRVLLSHGGGGKLMHDLIEKIFVTAFDNDLLQQKHDATLLDVSSQRMAFTTDSYVIHPLFFPGGNIGSLSVCGTVNDLSMAGAVPRYISVGVIIEEGLKMEDLWRIVVSMKETADKAGVKIATGDTKVVEKGKGDGIFINTSGIGVVPDGISIHPRHVQEGDWILVNGDIGRHGVAILAQREGLSFETKIDSDCAPLNDLVQSLLSSGIEIHCLRDLTRGGLASAMKEIALSARVGLMLDEQSLPVREDVKGVCEMLGLDPLYLPCEGRMALFVPEKDKDRALQAMQKHPLGTKAAIVGRVVKKESSRVTMKTILGVERIVDMLSTDPLPRIC